MTTQLNDNHKRILLLTFEHIDRLLSGALQALNSAEVPSPFQLYMPDFSSAPKE
jgi:hypothetical protein